MATLTSTGAVNLTASTNWSPASIPTTGDILIVGAHTLTLDADIELVDLKLTATTSRLAYSGGPRVISITGEFWISAAISATAITLTTGQDLTFRFLSTSTGMRGSTAFTQYPFTVNGGTLSLICHDGTNPDPDRDLINSSTATSFRVFSSANATSTITTVGRMSIGNGTHFLINASGGTWTHTHSGTMTFNTTTNSAKIVSCTGSVTASNTWIGDVESNCPVSTTGLFIWSNANATNNFTGKSKTTLAHGAGAIHYISAGIVNYTGSIVHSSGTNSLSFWQAGGIFNWTSQSVTIASDEVFTMTATAGSFNISSLLVTNNNKWVGVIYGSATGSSVGAIITNNPGASASINYLDPTIVTTPDPAPVLPIAAEVLSGTVYGYAATPLTGTGALIDPGVLASSISTALSAYDTNGVASRNDLATLGTLVNQNDIKAILENSSGISY